MRTHVDKNGKVPAEIRIVIVLGRILSVGSIFKYL